MVPKTISLSQEPKGIVIVWDDGEKMTYPFSLLRRSCPCALCKGEKIPFAPDPLVLPSFPSLPPAAYEAREMFKVGNYALGFRWGDGHDTGIYTFEYLRQICPS